MVTQTLPSVVVLVFTKKSFYSQRYNTFRALSVQSSCYRFIFSCSIGYRVEESGRFVVCIRVAIHYYLLCVRYF